MLLLLRFGELLGLELQELLDEGDLGEVIVPHADTAAADVGVVAVIVGEAGDVYKRQRWRRANRGGSQSR